MAKINLSREEYSLLNSSLSLNLNRVEHNKNLYMNLSDRYEQMENNLVKTLNLTNDIKLRANNIIDLEANDILNICESLLYRLEELNALIAMNKSDTYLTNIYTKDKELILELHEKIMLSRYNKNEHI